MALSSSETMPSYQPVKGSPFHRTSLIWAALVFLALAVMTSILTIAATPLENLPARKVIQVQYGESATLSPDDLVAGTVTEKQLPYGRCCTHDYAVFEFPLTSEDKDLVDPAILMPHVLENASLYIDGKWIAGFGKLSHTPNRYPKLAHLHRLPPHMLPDAKVMQIVITRDRGRKLLAPAYIGEHADLWPVRIQIHTTRIFLPAIHIVICFFVALFSAAAASLFRARSVLYATSLLMGVWGLVTALQFITTPLISGALVSCFYYSAFWGVLMASICFVLEWTSFLPKPKPVATWRGLDLPFSKRQVRRAELACLIIWVLMSIISAYLSGLHGAKGATWANIFVSWAALIIMPVLGIRLIAYYSGHVRESIIEAAAFLLIIAAVIFDMAMVRFADAATDLIAAASLFFPFALLLSLARRAQTVFDAALATNEQLDASVKEAEARILAGQQTLRARERQNTLTEERARIMRDMHDGVGGRLISILLMVRRKETDEEMLEDEIQSAIDELRLMIDSLDSVGTSLDTALALFQERARIRLSSAGINFTWRNNLEEAADSFGPKVILQVYRIIQEALTNIQKHANAKNVYFSVERAPGDRPLRVIIQDDGRGINGRSKMGRGLKSMESRAAAIGARIRFDDANPGTRVVLALPEVSD